MRFFKVIIFLISFQVLTAQQLIQNIDSVKQLVLVDNHDSSSIDNLLFLSYLYANIDPEKSIAYADTVYEVTLSYPYEEAFLKSFYLKAKTYIVNSQYEKGKEVIDKIIKDKRLKKYPGVNCDCLRIIGSYYYWNHFYSEAIDYFLASVKIGKEINDITCNGGNLYNIANIYKDIGNDSMAMIYFKKSLEDIKGSSKNNMVSLAYKGIATISENKQQVKMALDSALYYAKKSLNPVAIQLVYRDIGYFQFEEENFQDALNTFEKIINLYAEHPTMIENSEDYLSLAMLNIKIGNTIKGRQFYNQAMSINDSLLPESNDLLYIRNHAIYSELNGDFEKAIELYRDYFKAPCKTPKKPSAS